MLAATVDSGLGEGVAVTSGLSEGCSEPGIGDGADGQGLAAGSGGG